MPSARLFLTAVLTVATLAVSAPATALRPSEGEHRAGHGLAVTGFALGGLSGSVLRRDAHALSTVTVDGVPVADDGASVPRPDASVTKVLAKAHEKGLSSELLVSNYSDRRFDFDPRVARRLLGDEDHIAAVATQLAGFVDDQGWDGVNVDLERVSADDAQGLVDLVQALQDAMPAEKTVSIDISAATSVRGYADGGYDLAALGDAADVVAVMAYDQHGPTWSGPGPVGDLRWQKRAMGAAMRKIPADRLDLGVAGYGYTWPEHGTGKAISPRKARHLAGKRATWHRSSGEWSAKLADGTEIWWSDARSYRQRVQLARAMGVHGLALWRLGLADPLP